MVQPHAVEETNDIKILRDFNIHTDKHIKHRRPDIVVHNKREKMVSIIDVAIPADIRVKTKYTEKLEKYTDLGHEIKRIWQLKVVKIIPIIIGALGAIPKETEVALKKINVPILSSFQKSALLSTAGILRRVLSFDNQRRRFSPVENGKNTTAWCDRKKRFK